MGFGFNLFFIFILLPLTLILLLVWVFSKKKIVGKIVGFTWITIIVLVIFSTTVKTITSKKKLQKSDYYGEYIIDKDFFPGKQSNWQYEHFRFEIKRNDKIYFYEMEKDKIVKTYIGTISTVKPWNSERLKIIMEKPTIHIMKSYPTIYRNTWDFYLVFYSEKFNNMYFKKGKWKPLHE